MPGGKARRRSGADHNTVSRPFVDREAEEKAGRFVPENRDNVPIESGKLSD